MQQVTSHIPLVYQFFSDLRGFSGFFSRSPKKSSVLDRLPRASTVRWNFHIYAVNTVFEHKGDIIQCFETIRGVWAYHCGGSWRVCEATGGWLWASSWNYFIALCLVWTFSSASFRSGQSTQTVFMPRVDILFSQLQKWTIDSDSLSPGESCGSSHSFSDFSVHDLILAVAGNGIIKGRLPQQNVLHEQAPTGACPARASSSLVAALILQCFSWYSKALYIITSKTEQHIKSRLKKKKRHHILKAVEEVGFGQWGEHGQVWPH